MFEEIGSRVGKVVEVARETLDKSVLEFGRMRLQVEQFRDVYTVLHLNSFGYSYPVSIREEVQSRSAEESRGEMALLWMGRGLVMHFSSLGLLFSHSTKGKGRNTPSQGVRQVAVVLTLRGLTVAERLPPLGLTWLPGRSSLGR